MDNPLLASLGVRRYDDVLSADFLGRLEEAMRGAAGDRSSVYFKGGSEVRIDESVRRSKALAVDPALVDEFDVELHDVHDRIRNDFRRDLTSPTQFEFLRYEPDDRFVAHRDRPSADEQEIRSDLAQRQVSAVLFVNGTSRQATDNGYTGGELVFRVSDDPSDTYAAFGFGTTQAGGSMVAFPADVLHEVAPVRSGVRLTVVSWYLGQQKAPVLF